MLVLSRKEGERIQIGDETVITITKIAGNRVAVSIEAPQEVSIRRSELIEFPNVAERASDAQESNRQGCVPRLSA